MAIIKSLAVRNARKKLAGMVYYKRGGQDLVREQAASVSNPRTVAQMDQRVKWANLVAFYKANKGWMNAHAFESKKATQSDYNKFMSINLANNPVYLDKTQASDGTVIAAPYIISQGSLSPVQLQATDGVTTLKLTQPITNETTVAAFSTDLLANNPSWQEGDQLSLIVNAGYNTDDIPMIQVAALELIIDTNDTSLLSANNLGGLLDKTNEDKLKFDLDVTDFVGSYDCVAVAGVHSRTVSGKTSVSTETLSLDSEAQTLVAQYSGSDVKRRARNSYGLNRQYFLDAGIEGHQDVEPNPTINMVYFNGTPLTQEMSLEMSADVNIQFSKAYARNANTKVYVATAEGEYVSILTSISTVHESDNVWAFTAENTDPLDDIARVKVVGTAEDADAVIAIYEV